MTDEWRHLEAVVAKFVSAGNAVVDGGFRGTQGGTECGLRDPLDVEVGRAAAAADARILFDPEADELHCRHCWTIVYGGSAAKRYEGDFLESLQRLDIRWERDADNAQPLPREGSRTTVDPHDRRLS